MAHVRQIAARPHVTGSDANREVRDYLVGELRRLGLTVETRRTPVVYDHPRREETRPRVAWPENILARLASDGDAPALTLMTHYDSAAGAPGAGDAASGVATILETVRALAAAGVEPSRDLIVVITDGEEVGLMGAQAFLRTHPWARDIGLVLNFEARGAAGPVFMFETGAGNGALVRSFARAAPYPVANSSSVEIYRRMPNDTDATIVAAAGLPFLNFAFIDDFFRYHAATDTPGNLSLRSLQHEGANALALTRHFLASASLPPTGGDVTFFNLSRALLVHYSPAVVWIVGLLAMALSGAAIFLAWRRGRISPTGLAWAILGLTGAAAAAFWLVTTIQTALTSAAPPYAYFYRYHQLFAAYLLLTLALALGVWNRRAALRRGVTGAAAVALVVFWGRLPEIGAGALAAAGLLLAYGFAAPERDSDDLLALQHLLGAVALAALLTIAPHASYLLAWPLLLAAGLWLAAGTGGFAALGPLIPWILFWSAVLYSLFQALGVFQPGAAMALMIILLAAGAGWLARSRTAAPIVLVLALAQLVYTVATVGPSPREPRPTELFYALDADRGEAWWAHRGETLPAWALEALGGPPEALAAARWFPHADQPWSGIRAPLVPLLAPALEPGLGKRSDDGFSETLALSVPPGVERIDLLLPPADYTQGTIAGEPVPLPAPGESWRWRLYAPPAGPIMATIAGRGPGPGRLVLTGIHYSWPEPVASLAPIAPADSMPRVWGFHGAAVVARTIDLAGD